MLCCFEEIRHWRVRFVEIGALGLGLQPPAFDTVTLRDLATYICLVRVELAQPHN